MFDSKCQDIEDQLARDRAALAATLAALKDRVSGGPAALDVLGLIQSNAGHCTRVTISAVRAHPIAFAVVGAGLAWALLGRKPEPAPSDGLSGTKFEALSRWEDEGGPAVPLQEPDLNCPDGDWLAEVETLRAKASAALAGLETMARAGLATVVDHAQQRAAILVGLAQDVRAALRTGLEQLSHSAQEQIATAREAAYTAQLNARTATGKMIEDHPLATAGAALALGLAVGAALPRKQAQDRAPRPEHERLLAEARHLLAKERLRTAAAMALLARNG